MPDDATIRQQRAAQEAAQRAAQQATRTSQESGRRVEGVQVSGGRVGDSVSFAQGRLAIEESQRVAALQADGKVVIAGSTYMDSAKNFTIARFFERVADGSHSD